MISLEAMGRETFDHSIAVSSASPLESLVEPHAAIEVAILPQRLLKSQSVADSLLHSLKSIPAGMVLLIHVMKRVPFRIRMWADLRH